MTTLFRKYGYEIQTQKGSNERLFILTHSVPISGEIPLIKPQNDT